MNHHQSQQSKRQGMSPEDIDHICVSLDATLDARHGLEYAALLFNNAVSLVQYRGSWRDLLNLYRESLPVLETINVVGLSRPHQVYIDSADRIDDPVRKQVPNGLWQELRMLHEALLEIETFDPPKNINKALRSETMKGYRAEREGERGSFYDLDAIRAEALRRGYWSTDLKHGAKKRIRSDIIVSQKLRLQHKATSIESLHRSLERILQIPADKPDI